MLKLLRYARGVGPYRDFSWIEGTPHFARYNLLYGWNYAGKTSLSRMFSALELGLDKQPATGTFCFELDDGAECAPVNEPSAQIQVRVFNRDFRERNFREEHTAPALYLVGERSIELEQRLGILQRGRQRALKVSKRRDAEIGSLTHRLDTSATEVARNVKHSLSLPDYDRTKLRARIAEVSGTPIHHVLTDSDVASNMGALAADDSFAALEGSRLEATDLAESWRHWVALLSRNVVRTTIEELAANPALQEWVHEGLGFHENSTTCAFCKGDLDSNRLAALEGHFSESHRRLVVELDAAITELGETSLSRALCRDLEILPQLRPRLALIRSALDKWERETESRRGALLTALKAKRANPSVVPESEPNSPDWASLRSLNAEYSELVDAHNRMAADLDETKAKATARLERHFAAQYVLDQDPVDAARCIEECKAQSARAQSLADRLLRDIQDIERTTNEAEVGADRLNRYLGYLMPDNRLVATHVGRSRFQIMREGRVASQLSEGEQTAVALSYFLTGLEERGRSLEETVVFIDDPVSSLDASHTYSVHALVCERLANCKQLFLSTHSSELFAQFKRSWIRDKPDASTAYLVERAVDEHGLYFSRVKALPNLLAKFDSEYEFVFSQVHELACSDAPTLHEAYTAPTLLRKLLEGYLGFIRPDIATWGKKLKLLFNEEAEAEIARFVNDASHLQNLERLHRIPNYVESSQRCAMMVIEAIEDHDPAHGQALKAVAARA